MIQSDTGRPMSVALCGGILGVVGLLCVLFSVPATLTGLFVGPHILLVAIGNALVGTTMLVMTWGLLQGKAWAWWGTLSLALLLLALMCFWVYEVVVVEGTREPAGVMFPVSVGFVFGLVLLLLVQRGTRAWFGSLRFQLRTLVAMILSTGLVLGFVKWCVDRVRADQAAHSQQPQTSVAPGALP